MDKSNNTTLTNQQTQYNFSTTLFNLKTKKLQRKPPTIQLQSPKSRFTQHLNTTVVENDANKFKFNTITRGCQYGSPTIDSMMKNTMCYFSPKNSKNITASFVSPKRTVKLRNQQNMLKQQLSVKDDIELQTQLRPPSVFQLQPTPKRHPIPISPTFSRTTRTLPMRNSRKFHTPQITTILNDEQLSYNQQHSQLKTQNTKLNSRIHDLKQQNQYLYKQIQQLNELVAEKKEINEQLVMENDGLHRKVQQQQKIYNQYKCTHKLREDASKKYEILQHMYKKLQYQHTLVKQKKQILSAQNQKLAKRIEILGKMLDQCPKKQKKQRSKSKGRELSPVYDKQNVVQVKQTGRRALPKPELYSPSRISHFDIKNGKNVSHSRNYRDNTIFELSPE